MFIFKRLSGRTESPPQNKENLSAAWLQRRKMWKIDRIKCRRNFEIPDCRSKHCWKAIYWTIYWTGAGIVFLANQFDRFSVVPRDMAFKFIVKVPEVGNTADTPNPLGIYPFKRKFGRPHGPRDRPKETQIKVELVIKSLSFLGLIRAGYWEFNRGWSCLRLCYKITSR